MFPLVQNWATIGNKDVVSTVANSDDDIPGREWRGGVLGGDQVRWDWLAGGVCRAVVG